MSWRGSSADVKSRKGGREVYVSAVISDDKKKLGVGRGMRRRVELGGSRTCIGLSEENRAGIDLKPLKTSTPTSCIAPSAFKIDKGLRFR